MKINKLRGARNEHGYSQKEMAEFLGLSTDAYRMKEVRETEFKLSEIKKIMKILDKGFYDLFMYEEGNNDNKTS